MEAVGRRDASIRVMISAMRAELGALYIVVFESVMTRLQSSLLNRRATRLSKIYVNQRVKASPSGPSSLRTLSAMRSKALEAQMCPSDHSGSWVSQLWLRSQLVRLRRSLRLGSGSFRISCSWSRSASGCFESQRGQPDTVDRY